MNRISFFFLSVLSIILLAYLRFLLSTMMVILSVNFCFMQKFKKIWWHKLRIFVFKNKNITLNKFVNLKKNIKILTICCTIEKKSILKYGISCLKKTKKNHMLYCHSAQILKSLFQKEIIRDDTFCFILQYFEEKY